MTDEEVEAQIEKLILGCNGEIPTLIRALEKMREKYPQHKFFFDAVQAGLKRAIGKIS